MIEEVLRIVRFCGMGGEEAEGIVGLAEDCGVG